MAGEARQRGTYAERRAHPQDTIRARPLARFRSPIPPLRFIPWRKRALKQRNDTPKRERAKIMCSFKRHYGLNRRQMGAIGAGHLPAPW